jgi:transcriptional regulator with XRE-family HTH domain
VRSTVPDPLPTTWTAGASSPAHPTGAAAAPVPAARGAGASPLPSGCASSLGGQGSHVPGDGLSTPRPRVPDLRDPRRLADFAAELRRLRIAAGMTPGQVAAAVRATRPTATSATITKAESGGYVPRADTLRPWLSALGVEPGPFLAAWADVEPPAGPVTRPTTAPRRPVRTSDDSVYDRLGRAPAAGDTSMGAELWRRRVALGLSRRDLAGVLRVARWTVWSRETGIRPVSTALLARWADALGDIERMQRAARGGRRVVDAPPDLAMGAPTVDTTDGGRDAPTA